MVIVDVTVEVDWVLLAGGGTGIPMRDCNGSKVGAAASVGTSASAPKSDGAAPDSGGGGVNVTVSSPTFSDPSLLGAAETGGAALSKVAAAANEIGVLAAAEFGMRPVSESGLIAAAASGTVRGAESRVTAALRSGVLADAGMKVVEAASSKLAREAVSAVVAAAKLGVAAEAESGLKVGVASDVVAAA